MRVRCVASGERQRGATQRASDTQEKRASSSANSPLSTHCRRFVVVAKRPLTQNNAQREQHDQQQLLDAGDGVRPALNRHGIYHLCSFGLLTDDDNDDGERASA